MDPFCGSGTIVIEAALLARNVAPGLAAPPDGERTRRYAFLRWPGFDPARWEAIVADAERLRDQSRGATIPTIQGSDRDAGGTAAAVANARRAGVADDVEITTRPLSAVEPPSGPGWLVSNPPYGVRVGESDRLRNLYAQLGKVARRRCPGWSMALLMAGGGLERETGMRFAELLHTANGGILVRLLATRIPGAGA